MPSASWDSRRRPSCFPIVAVLTCASLLSSGCLVPLVMPPMSASLGGTSYRPGGPGAIVHRGWGGGGAQVQLGLGLAQLVPARAARHWDVQLGLQLDSPMMEEPPTYAAGSLDVIVRPWVWWVAAPLGAAPMNAHMPNERFVRIGLGLGVENVGMLEHHGFGGRATLLFDYGGFARGKFHGSGGPPVAGLWYGEGSVGLYTQLGYRSVDAMPYWTFSAGLRLVMPAMLGAALAI